MSLSPGTRLGHYAVTSLLGEGGMGQVWQATDTQLNRQVALKILPDAFADDPDRLARFTRGAQILASLNHPNIAQIHGIEEAEGTQALVLELVEGPTLADRIAKGPIPLDEALPIARQIAEALEAAHEAGVIHRDLKPANIKVREDGTVKVLDFGLAKALDPNPEGDPSQSPTLTAAATQMGVIMGTAAYMSPEQARGKPVDKRTDIWAFGCVLFEMITGRLAFAGETISDAIAKLLEHKPPWNALPSGTPSAVRRLLHRCLDKAPRDRLHDMADARLEITEAVSTPDAETTEVLAVRPLQVWQRPIPAAVLVVALVALTGLSIWFVAETDSAEVVRFSIAYDESLALFVADSSPDVAMSPDGRHVAYLAGGGMLAADELRVRSLDRMSSFTVAAGGEFRSPFFSPDSGSVGFFARQGSARLLSRRVSVLGGPAVTICEVDTPLRGASWGMDGTIIFGSSDTSTGLWRVSDAGGEPELLTTPDSEQDEVDHYWPHILPGGGAVLFTVVGNVQDFQIEDARIAVLSLETNEWKVLLRGGAFPQYSPSGHLVYVAAGRLWAVGFDLHALETVGESVPVLEGVPTKRHGSANVGLSQSGAMVYMPTGGSMGEQRTLVWIDQEGREETLDVDTAPYESPRVSPDGRYVALEVRNPQNTDVVVYDRERRTQTRLTSDPAFDGHPLWSPDGRRVFFSSDRGGAQDVFSNLLTSKWVEVSEPAQLARCLQPICHRVTTID